MTKFIIIVVSIFLTACQQAEKDDLNLFIAEIKAQQSIDIEPMPEISIYEKFLYSASDLRSPFIPTVLDIPAIAEEEEEEEIVDNGIRPNKSRLKEELELFTRQELALVGTLEQDGQIWALIRTPEGIIHKVKQGNYLGKNDGKIIELTDAGLVLKEVVLDGKGGYVEQEITLALISGSKD